MENIVWKDTVWKNIVWKNTAMKNTVLNRLDPFKTVETVLNPLQLEFCAFGTEKAYLNNILMICQYYSNHGHGGFGKRKGSGSAAVEKQRGGSLRGGGAP